MEVDKDHIYILIETNPKTNLLKLIKNLKQITTYRIWRQNNNHLLLSKYFWLEKTFWSDGYFVVQQVIFQNQLLKNIYKIKVKLNIL